MSKCSCNTRILKSFAARIETLHETVQAQSTAGVKLLATIRTLFEIKGLSKIVIRKFTKDWQEASCHINADENCITVLQQAADIRDQLVQIYGTLSTLPSPFAHWAAKRLTGPVLDWNDLLLDFSIASDQEIQNSLTELEEVL